MVAGSALPRLVPPPRQGALRRVSYYDQRITRAASPSSITPSNAENKIAKKHVRTICERGMGHPPRQTL